MRRFRSTTGRFWSVDLAVIDRVAMGRSGDVAESGQVLRFQSPDGLICDLEDYPSDWDRFTEKGLVSLLGMAMCAWSAPNRD